MSKYTLTINIMSDNQELLENLMLTLEAVSGDIREVDCVELLTTCGEKIKHVKHETTTLQRDMFLDKWVFV